VSTRWSVLKTELIKSMLEGLIIIKAGTFLVLEISDTSMNVHDHQKTCLTVILDFTYKKSIFFFKRMKIYYVWTDIFVSYLPLFVSQDNEWMNIHEWMTFLEKEHFTHLHSERIRCLTLLLLLQLPTGQYSVFPIISDQFVRICDVNMFLLIS